MSETEEESVKRLSTTKTTEDLLRLKASLEGSMAISPPGEHYGQLVKAIIIVTKALDLQKRNEPQILP